MHSKARGAGARAIRVTAVVIRPLDRRRGVDARRARARENSQDLGAARVDLQPAGLGNGELHQPALIDVALGAVGVVKVDR